MKKFKYSKYDLDYLKANIFSATQDIYLNCYNRITATLPKGRYSVAVGEDENCQYICDELKRLYNLKAFECEDKNGFEFDITDDYKIFSFCLYYTDHLGDIVLSLREQAIYNKRLGYETLIQKDIKANDLGEDYNRESFYDTIQECFSDETLIVDKSKPVNNSDTKILRLAKVSQEKVRLQKQLDDLNNKFSQEKAGLQNQLSGLNTEEQDLLNL